MGVYVDINVVREYVHHSGVLVPEQALAETREEWLAAYVGETRW